jgi:uncharacterized protein (DUF1778 family)
MATANPRDRMVVFRLTKDEYAFLQKECAAALGSTLSDYIRSELLSAIQSKLKRTRDFQRLEHNLTRLDERIVQLLGLLAPGSDHGKARLGTAKEDLSSNEFF